MVGTWRWNVGFGVAGGLLTLLFSMNSNTFGVSVIRSGYALAAFFVLAYLFRAVLSFALAPTPGPLGADDRSEEQTAGSRFEAVTPDETDELHDMLKTTGTNNMNNEQNVASSSGSGFQPLKPPKLVSTQNKEPEELAKAIRHLTGG
ncbi:conserved hypothetical protein [Paenibacillus curdlanolyticus YK9]|uniref:Uncharacterized protein n=1 Tax=Paenibacillus curdlanolyticus YK9 TaxID=717606 RepID=E0I468_9BACL|nr:hypothetical protein [Paenibacillus curdlanolyticus]EFM13082.1 conserved hypothetical protein [Paenibacillus curdlanolyticus YK9]